MKKLLLFFLLFLVSCGSKSSSSPSLDVVTSHMYLSDGRVGAEFKFSKPMVPKDSVGTPALVELTTNPKLVVNGTWLDEHTIFVTSETIPEQMQDYKISIAGELKSADGTKMGKKPAVKFTGPAVTAWLSPVRKGAFSDVKAKVRMTLSNEVEVGKMYNKCWFVAEDGKTVGARVDSKKKKSREISWVSNSSLKKGSSYQFTCDEATVAKRYGSDRKISEEIKTFGDFNYESMKPSDGAPVSDANALVFAFTTPFAEEKKVKIEPAVRGFPERCYAYGSPGGLSCDVELKPRTKYTVHFDKDQEDAFGQKLGVDKTISFETGDAEPSLSLESGYFVAELKRPSIPVWTRNVKEISVRAIRILPSTFHKLQGKMDWWEHNRLSSKAVRFKTEEVKIEGAANEWGQYSLKPETIVGGSSGPGMYYVELTSKEVDDYPYDNGKGVQKVLANFTDIGVVSKLSGPSGLVWTTRLSTGAPLSGASVQVRDGKGKVLWSGVSDESGLAKLPSAAKLPILKQGEWNWKNVNIFVKKGNDFTFLNGTKNGGLGAWNFNISEDISQKNVQLRGFMHTDRGLYRPGEKVHVKGLVRETRLGQALKVPKKSEVEVVVKDPRGKDVHTTKATVSAFGGFWLDVELPEDSRLGDYRIDAKFDHGTFTKTFSVEKYRPATFEVDLKPQEELMIASGKMKATVLAKYFYGAPMRDAIVDYSVHARRRSVAFPGFESYRFLKEDERYGGDYSQSFITDGQAEFSGDKGAELSIGIEKDDVGFDSDLLVRATVSSPSNEVISKSFTVPYFSKKKYFGLKTPGYFLDTKKTQRFSAVLLDAAGKPVAGKGTILVKKRDWNCVWNDWGYRGSYNCEEKDEKVLDKKVSFTTDPIDFEFIPSTSGDYVVEVSSADKEVATASEEIFAYGGGGGSWQSSDSLTFDIIKDKKSYRSGDVARLALKTNLANATGLVTIERDGVIEERLVKIDKANKSLEIPITEAHAPNIYVSVALVQGRSGEGARGKPQMKMGVVNLPVKQTTSELKVAVTTDKKEYRPGELVTASVSIVDTEGQPVVAEVALTAADEGVLSLIGFKTPNPLSSMFSPWGLGVITASQFSYLRDLPAKTQKRPATGGDSGAPGTVRANFLASAYWKPGIQTDVNGKATVTFSAPDNLTAFRLMAVAADKGTKFGSADKRFTVAKPLQAHRYLPRFVSVGDQLMAGVVVHNETGKAGTATVTVKPSFVSIDGERTKRVTIPAGGQIPVTFAVGAKVAEKGSLLFDVKLNGETDTVRYKLPSKYPTFKKRQPVAAGSTKDKKAILAKVPEDAMLGTAKLHVSLDPNGLAGLERGLKDLIEYPYGCLEQTTSRVIPMVAVRGLAESLEIEGLKGDALDYFVKEGISRIIRHQTDSGGFSLWPGGEASPYYTAYALWGLHQAKRAGYPVSASRIKEGLRYLRNHETDASKETYDASGELSNQAFSFYVRAVLGDPDTAGAAKLLEQSGQMTNFGKAFLARALAVELGKKDKSVMALTTELNQLASSSLAANKLIGEGKSLSFYMSSDMRTSAAVLEALVVLDSKSKNIKPLVRLVMKERRKNRHLNTQENLYGLLALSRYADKLGRKGSTVAVTIGGKSLGNLKLTGKMGVRTVDYLLNGDAQVELQSKGEVYYDAYISYAVDPQKLKATNNGLEIKREYLNENDKIKTSFKVGDIVKVRLTLPLTSNVNHLMVSDSVPAGFEILNAKLASGGSSISTKSSWGGTMEIHDDRVDFANEYNWRSSYVREYLMRATNAGEFLVAPAVAELMYEPEINGNTDRMRVVVKAK